jgi:hypothetical protein
MIDTSRLGFVGRARGAMVPQTVVPPFLFQGSTNFLGEVIWVALGGVVPFVREGRYASWQRSFRAWEAAGHGLGRRGAESEEASIRLVKEGALFPVVCPRSWDARGVVLDGEAPALGSYAGFLGRAGAVRGEHRGLDGKGRTFHGKRGACRVYLRGPTWQARGRACVPRGPNVGRAGFEQVRGAEACASRRVSARTHVGQTIRDETGEPPNDTSGPPR